MNSPWKNLRLDDSNRDWITLWIDVVDRKLNVLSSEVFRELQQVTQWLITHSDSRAIVVRSAKERGFVVGADLREILQIQSDDEAQRFLHLGQLALNAWERLPNATVAWISGACLGGGLELALACRYRVARDSEDTQLGMPESKLGLTPGWGGTQRLPALVGIPHAMPMLLFGESIDCKAAAAMGLVDGTWSGDLVEDEIAQWLASARDGRPVAKQRHRSRSELQQQWAQWTSPDDLEVADANQDLDVAIDARKSIVIAVENGLKNSTAAGMQTERENFFKLLRRPEVQKMLQRFAPRKVQEKP